MPIQGASSCHIFTQGAALLVLGYVIVGLADRTNDTEMIQPLPSVISHIEANRLGERGCA